MYSTYSTSVRSTDTYSTLPGSLPDRRNASLGRRENTACGKYFLYSVNTPPYKLQIELKLARKKIVKDKICKSCISANVPYLVLSYYRALGWLFFINTHQYPTYSAVKFTLILQIPDNLKLT